MLFASGTGGSGPSKGKFQVHAQGAKGRREGRSGHRCREQEKKRGVSGSASFMPPCGGTQSESRFNVMGL